MYLQLVLFRRCKFLTLCARDTKIETQKRNSVTARVYVRVRASEQEGEKGRARTKECVRKQERCPLARKRQRMRARACERMRSRAGDGTGHSA